MIPSCATDKVSLKELTGVAKTAVLRLLSPSTGSSTSAISASKLSMAAAMMLRMFEMRQRARSLVPPLLERKRRGQCARAERGACSTAGMGDTTDFLLDPIPSSTKASIPITILIQIL